MIEPLGTLALAVACEALPETFLEATVDTFAAAVDVHLYAVDDQWRGTVAITIQTTGYGPAVTLTPATPTLKDAHP